MRVNPLLNAFHFLCFGFFVSQALCDDAIHVSSTGKVGINKNSPDEKLHVDGKIKVTSGSAPEHAVLSYNDLSFSRNADSYIVQKDSTGRLRVQIGTADNLILDVDDSYFEQNVNVASGKTLSVTSNLKLSSVTNCTSLKTDSNGVVGCAPSNLTHKVNVKSLESGLSLIEKLRPVRFHWKDPVNGTQEEFGLIAEETEKVDSRLASYESQGELKGVKYMSLVPVLINAVREQQKEINELRKQIGEIEK